MPNIFDFLRQVQRRLKGCLSFPIVDRTSARWRSHRLVSSFTTLRFIHLVAIEIFCCVLALQIISWRSCSVTLVAIFCNLLSAALGISKESPKACGVKIGLNKMQRKIFGNEKFPYRSAELYTVCHWGIIMEMTKHMLHFRVAKRGGGFLYFLDQILCRATITAKLHLCLNSQGKAAENWRQKHGNRQAVSYLKMPPISGMRARTARTDPKGGNVSFDGALCLGGYKRPKDGYIRRLVNKRSKGVSFCVAAAKRLTAAVWRRCGASPRQKAPRKLRKKRIKLWKKTMQHKTKTPI